MPATAFSASEYTSLIQQAATILLGSSSAPAALAPVAPVPAASSPEVKAEVSTRRRGKQSQTEASPSPAPAPAPAPVSAKRGGNRKRAANEINEQPTAVVAAPPAPTSLDSLLTLHLSPLQLLLSMQLFRSSFSNVETRMTTIFQAEREQSVEKPKL